MMHPQIKKLLILQECDIMVMRLEGELQRLPAEEAMIMDRLRERSEELERMRRQAQVNEAEQKRIDLEVRSLKEQIQRYQTQQLQTRSNTEYQALSHEIEHARKKIEVLEEQELELMQAYEELERLIKQEAAKVEIYTQEANEARKELRKKLSNTEALLVKYRKAQKEAEEMEDSAVLMLYRRILKSKKDVAVVAMRNQTCSGCHLKVVAQTAIDVKEGKRLVACDHCGRLLFDPEE